jgi:hypothetical protein
MKGLARFFRSRKPTFRPADGPISSQKRTIYPEEDKLRFDGARCGEPLPPHRGFQSEIVVSRTSGRQPLFSPPACPQRARRFFFCAAAYRSSSVVHAAFRHALDGYLNKSNQPAAMHAMPAMPR